MSSDRFPVSSEEVAELRERVGVDSREHPADCEGGWRGEDLEEAGHVTRLVDAPGHGRRQRLQLVLSAFAPRDSGGTAAPENGGRLAPKSGGLVPPGSGGVSPPSEGGQKTEEDEQKDLAEDESAFDPAPHHHVRARCERENDTDAHPASCEDGWLGEDPQGRLVPCLVCRPHLARGSLRRYYA